MRTTRQFFPFGRGGRGSRQRPVVEIGRLVGRLTVYDVRLRVLRTHEPAFTVVMVGVSNLDGKRRVFFTSQIFEGFKTLVQATRDFRTVRRINKIKRVKA